MHESILILTGSSELLEAFRAADGIQQVIHTQEMLDQLLESLPFQVYTCPVPLATSPS